MANSNYLSEIAALLAMDDRLAAHNRTNNYLAELSRGTPSPPPPRSALADIFLSPELSDIGRIAPPPSGPFGLDAFRTPRDVPRQALPTSLTVTWAQPPGQWWYLENAANLSPTAGGVYIIWRDGDGACVKVGQGNIRDRLSAHCRDRAIISAARGATLRATWCAVQTHLRGSIERFLGEYYKPLVAERFPDARPIRVNLPS
jgi:hypothetical protein